MNSQTPTGAASFEKGLALFTLILRDDGQTPLTALAAPLALPRSTLHRLAGALEDAGLISRLERGRYVAGPALAERLGGMSWAGQLVRLARPLLRELANEYGATAHLGVMEHDMVTYLVKEAATGAPAVFTRETAQLEAYCSGIGKVLLAWLPEAERERYLAGGPFVGLTARTITDPAQLRLCLQQVRAEHYAVDNGEIAEGLYCLAVPVGLEHGSVRAGISLSFPQHAPSGDSHAARLDRLTACAAAVARRMGPPLTAPAGMTTRLPQADDRRGHGR